MRFISASAFWWLFLAAPIIFFYLLKLRRTRRVVSTTLLWKRAFEEMEANAPFRKLRRNLLLLLQLLVLAIGVMALARPTVRSNALVTGNTVIVIDSSASMSARDEDVGKSSRLDKAKAIARRIIDGLDSNARVAVIEASSKSVVRSPVSSDHSSHLRAISDIAETDTEGDLAGALLLAEQLAKSEREASIAVISDGAGIAPSSWDSRGTPTQFVRVGQRADNAAIVAMNSRRLPDGTHELFASIANFSERPRAFDAELRIDGRLVDARTVNVGPAPVGGQASSTQANRAVLTFDSLPTQGGLAELKLDVEDDLASDNVAYAYVPDARRIKVGVSADNQFLIQALAVNPAIEAGRLTPDSNVDSFDVLVGEGGAVASLARGRASLLAIDPPDISGLWQRSSSKEGPRAQSLTFERSHPVNAYLSYGDLHVETASARETSAWLKPILSDQSGGLIWAGDDGHRRLVMIGFDITKSDIALKVEFPILISNSISWLASRDVEAEDRAIRAGQPVDLKSSEKGPTLPITLPGGQKIEATPAQGSVTFADTNRVGVYRVEGANSFAASLFSESESDTTPRDSLTTRGGALKSQGERLKSERETWRWVAAAALALLALEWWVYQRRVAA
ncbi:MAG: hypothetical protein DMF61_00520 [Blastocatellia bacterium AA13]|nr:MAG: hypothetical protein DMF61_00520 [Blastocatellia bacterium AA13]